jgi:hypothetical protein
MMYKRGIIEAVVLKRCRLSSGAGELSCILTIVNIRPHARQTCSEL